MGSFQELKTLILEVIYSHTIIAHSFSLRAMDYSREVTTAKFYLVHPSTLICIFSTMHQNLLIVWRSRMKMETTQSPVNTATPTCQLLATTFPPIIISASVTIKWIMAKVIKASYFLRWVKTIRLNRCLAAASPVYLGKACLVIPKRQRNCFKNDQSILNLKAYSQSKKWVQNPHQVRIIEKDIIKSVYDRW